MGSPFDILHKLFNTLDEFNFEVFLRRKGNILDRGVEVDLIHDISRVLNRFD